MAISLGVIFFLRRPKLDFLATLRGLMPCLRRSALTRLMLAPRISPCSAAPFLLAPFQTYVSSFFTAFSAIPNPYLRLLHNLITLPSEKCFYLLFLILYIIPSPPC